MNPVGTSRTRFVVVQEPSLHRDEPGGGALAAHGPAPPKASLLRVRPLLVPPPEIIRLGHAVVPFMLQDLEKRPRLWVWALPDITGADPMPVSDRGNIAKMSEAWLRWGHAIGYQW